MARAARSPGSRKVSRARHGTTPAGARASDHAGGRLCRRAVRARRARVFGRATYAIGGNEEAARLSGVHVRFHKTAIYGVAGLMSAAGCGRAHRAAELGAADGGHDVRAGRDRRDRDWRHEPAGRRGRLTGALIGALIMGVLRNGLNLLERVVVLSAARHRHGDHRRGAHRHVAEAAAAIEAEGSFKDIDAMRVTDAARSRLVMLAVGVAAGCNRGARPNAGAPPKSRSS